MAGVRTGASGPGAATADGGLADCRAGVVQRRAGCGRRVGGAGAVRVDGRPRHRERRLRRRRPPGGGDRLPRGAAARSRGSRGAQQPRPGADQARPGGHGSGRVRPAGGGRPSALGVPLQSRARLLDAAALARGDRRVQGRGRVVPRGLRHPVTTSDWRWRGPTSTPRRRPLSSAPSAWRRANPGSCSRSAPS